jgi:uncharacterized protein DUF3592
MLLEMRAQKEKRTEYESAAWQPEPELLQPPPRSVSFSRGFKLVALALLLVAGFVFCVVLLPWLKYAYLTSYGVASNGTIEQRYRQRNMKTRADVYFLVVRYQTPLGREEARMQSGEALYAHSSRGNSIPLHYSARFPAQCVLDGDQVFRPWPGLIVVGVWVLMLLPQYYLYQKMRSLAIAGTPVKGLITKVERRRRRRYWTIYYEFQGAPYEGQVPVKPNRAYAERQPGTAITLLVSGPTSDARGSQASMIYPAPEFRVNQ